jgi:hypothetical protein
MADEGESSFPGEIPDDVCRDYMRNVCNRGQKCRFKHPDSGPEPKPEPTGLQDKVMFCHDFQNNRCARSNCKFIHCSKDAETEYLASGQSHTNRYLPPLVRDQIITKGVAADLPAVTGGVPVCKDFLKGKCVRRSRCKFRHLNPREYDMEMGNSGFPPSQNLLQTFFEEGDIGERRGPMERKRRMMETGVGFEIGPPPAQAFMMLQEENCQLKGRIGELEKKVSDLLATNEFLLDQNAQLRMGGAGQPPGPRPAIMYGRPM